MKKLLLYSTFVALAMVCAEIISFNEPRILLEPMAIVGYGVLYVVFLNTLLRGRLMIGFLST